MSAFSKARWFCLGWILCVAACGYSDSGSGTDTLEVFADAAYDTTSDAMTAEVTVLRAGSPVSDATLTFSDGDETWALAGDGDTYVATIPGYHRRLELRVVAGADHLTGKLEGPGAHEIASPNTGAQIPASELTVRWRVPDGLRADSVSLQLQSGRFQTTVDNDDGSAVLPGDRLVAGTDDALTLTRRNEIALAGGVGASYLRLSYSVAQTLRVVP